jgi:hypothetical protein
MTQKSAGGFSQGDINIYVGLAKIHSVCDMRWFCEECKEK